VVAILVQQPSFDPFVAQHDAAASKYTPGSHFTIATEDNRRTFQVGERIPLLLRYEGVWNRQLVEGRSLRDFADVVLDRTAGTADPLADYDRADFSVPAGVCDCVSPEGTCGCDAEEHAPVVTEYAVDLNPLFGRPPRAMPTPRPVQVRVLLNDAVRFDAPGHYRFYVADRYDRKYRESDASSPDAAGAPIVSNILELDITARDTAQEAAAIAAALRVLDTAVDPMAREEAAQTLRIVGSPRAIDEMAHRLVRASTDEDRRALEAGLFAAPDRDRAIARVAREADDPDASIPLTYLRTLAALRLTQTTPRGALNDPDKRAALIALETGRMTALKRAGTLIPSLVSTFEAVVASEDRRDLIGPLEGLAVTRAIAGFAEDVSVALRRLPAASRDQVVDRLSESFADARFMPLLDEMARGGSEAAVRVLTRIAPERAREHILTDLAMAHPRLSLMLSDTFPDATLPPLDGAFVAQLGAASDAAQFRDALERIARFASPAILSPVRDAYRARAASSPCDVAPPALSYFFRSDAGAGKAMWADVQRGGARLRAGCEQWPADLLGHVARFGWSPELEEFVAGFLTHDDPADVMAASATLSEHGSERAKPLIWQTLERWRERWTPSRAAALQASLTIESALEQSMISDLGEAAAWRLSPEEVTRLRSGCRLRGCEAAFRGLSGVDSRLKEPVMRAGYDPGARATGYWLGPRGLTLEQLERRVALYPPGTSFHWTGDYREPIEAWYGDAEAPFRAAQEIVGRHGMTLHRHARAR
jgi:hypothetical protein